MITEENMVNDMKDERKIKVSVVIPCFNDVEFLHEAIDSVNLKENTDTEIVICDDGSDQKETKEVLRKLEKENNPLIRVIYNDHKGPSAARNKAINASKGEYILPLDIDDRIEWEYIQKAEKILDEDPQCGTVYCHADLFGNEKGPWRLPDYSFDGMLLQSLVFITSMFRKKDWIRLGGFSEDLKAGMEDYDFFIGILSLGKNIIQLPEVMFHYRIRGQSRTDDFLSDKETVKKTFRIIYQRHRDFYEAHSEEYACILRDALVQEKYEKEKVLQVNAFIAKMKKNPVVNFFLKKIYR